ncbi:MAG: class I lanthipeptide [Dinghuibacter sp.]|nr:class I lanthipeptide [Dinghuibacter sp.]
MKQNPVRKLNLGKKTIARLNEQEAKAAQGGTLTTSSIIVVTGGCVTGGCATDITRTIRTIGTSW